jgi:hypothetical protein
VTLITRLCLNELDSARVRRERAAAIGCPSQSIWKLAASRAWTRWIGGRWRSWCCLQRLTPAERAVLLLRDVFDFDYNQIAQLVGKGEAACRKLLERAHKARAEDKRLFEAAPEEHRRMLFAFVQAARAGDVDGLVAMLAEHATITTDGGPEGRVVRGLRNLRSRCTAPSSGGVRDRSTHATAICTPRSTRSTANRASAVRRRARAFRGDLAGHRRGAHRAHLLPRRRLALALPGPGALAVLAVLPGAHVATLTPEDHHACTVFHMSSAAGS